MKMKLTALCTALIFSGFETASAQENTVVAGGEGTGNGGTVSFSIGQVLFDTQVGSNGSTAQGVQQPFEISTATGIEMVGIDLELQVFPNPTANYLTLKIDHLKDQSLSYQLFNLQGQVLQQHQVLRTKRPSR